MEKEENKIIICIYFLLQYQFVGNGYIPTSSLVEILGALDDQLTLEQLNEIVAEIDTDSSGTVDFDGKW